MINFFRLVLAGLALAMAGLIAAVVTMRLAIHGAEVKVPDLQGLTVTEAVHKTANMGLNLGIDNRYYSVDVPAGRVLAQSPLPGAIVRREWRMRVTESLGPQRVAIPKVVGQQERWRRSKCAASGWSSKRRRRCPIAALSRAPSSRRIRSRGLAAWSGLA